MDETTEATKSAVVFDWSGTLTTDEWTGTKSVENAIGGLSDFISALRAKGHGVYIATGGGYHEDMAGSFDHSEVRYTDSGYKGYVIDQLRREGYERIVYVGDSTHDVEHPATREVPVIMYSDADPATLKQRSIEYAKEKCDMVKAAVVGADVSAAFGLVHLESEIDAAMSRAHMPSHNRTQIRAFGSDEFAGEIARRIAEQMVGHVTIPIVGVATGENPPVNVPDIHSVLLTTREFKNGRDTAYEIEIDYPLSVPESAIVDALETVTQELRTKGILGMFGGFSRQTRLPDAARPSSGRGLA